ncbi:hypothetical protein K3495_g395 [Podosphaera aphanis]|nr:hypothetical protein K3495_g395 [Podosphaera aphanis]
MVGIGMDWKTFKRMTRDDCEELKLLGSEKLESGTRVEVPEILRINYQNFYNYRRKQMTNTRQLHPNCWQSLLEYTRLVTEAGVIVILDDVPEDKVDEYNVFCFAFCSSWQIEVILKYNSILFLDSTHNVCYSLEGRGRKAFFYSISVKHDAAGRGIPVAFMITDSETQRPIARWLNWLKEKVLFQKDPKFMIDCSATEMSAIRSVFENPQIRLCQWHMLRAMRTQANKKLHICSSAQGDSRKNMRKEVHQQLRISAVQDFLKLMRTNSVPEFGEVWKNYYRKYLDLNQLDWLEYLDSTWLKHPENGGLPIDWLVQVPIQIDLKIF